jgi:glyoxylase-like metal-dependent hydrolase (beta-lactamase superfamily II)
MSAPPTHDPAASTAPIRQERQPPRTVVEELAPGVLRAQLEIQLPGLGHINTYLIEGPDGFDVIDPGLPGQASWDSLVERFGQGGVPIKRVRHIVITHSHPDHYGNAQRLADMANSEGGSAQVITHRAFRTMFDPLHQCGDLDCADPAHAHPDAGQAELIEERRVSSDGYEFAMDAPWGKRWNPRADDAEVRRSATALLADRGWPFPTPARRARNGDTIELGGRTWHAVHTPGHTLDHLCLLDRENGIFISGDHILPTITPHVPGIGSGTRSLGDFLSSLDAAAALPDVQLVLPAHGLELHDLPTRVGEIKEHHRERLEILSRVSQAEGWTTVEGYSKFLFRPERWGSLAESETYAHLEYLVQRAIAERRTSSEGLAEYLVHEAPASV